MSTMPEVAGADRSARTRLRCAIYTRKSTEEGLHQPFNSLEAQRECGEAYVLSQRHAGWTLMAERYDDGGYTGGNLERPALQRLLVDVQAGHIDCVIVYKVDRLSRSLLDFARLMEVLVFLRCRGNIPDPTATTAENAQPRTLEMYIRW